MGDRNGQHSIRINDQWLNLQTGLLNMNRTEFILNTAVQRSEEVILDQQLIAVDEERFKRFVAALDAPPAKNPRLQRLMTRKAPWE